MWSRPRRDDRAVSAVEFSIVAPVLLLLIFAVINAGLWYYGRNIAQTSAREGVSYLRLAGTNADPGAFEAEAKRVSEIYASRLGSLEDVRAVPDIDSRTGRVSMKVTGELDLPLGNWTITQTAEATLEQFRGDPRGDES
ncbi:MAG: TadE/TadG family type IV pilus assembly protein [Nocardioidaceae bacterium]